MGSLPENFPNHAPAIIRMSLFAFGINHKTAPVAIRERVSIGPERMAEALQELTSRPAVNEAIILSTCNRTELYCDVDGDDGSAAVSWFGEYHHLQSEQFLPYLYTHPGGEAVRHVLRVASGLDSMVLGEPQILGQVKDAFRQAQQAGTIGKLLGRLFQHTFSVAKQVRTDTAIGSSPVSVAFAAVRLAQQIFDDLSHQTALLIGAGETIELAARHLHDNGIKRLVIANRTVERAHVLAEEVGGYAISLGEIPAHLVEADVVISSTGSPLPILGKGSVENALRRRRHKPMLLVDIAVPRDIEPQVAELDDVYLYTVDDLHEVIQENQRSREAAAAQAEEIIDTQVSHFLGWLGSQNAVNTILSYRSAAEETRNEVLEKTRRLLAKGVDPDEAMQYLATTLTNKLVHEPCVQLRQAAFEGRKDMLENAERLLGIAAAPPKSKN
jgi:glutamyl-tRNA reductase